MKIGRTKSVIVEGISGTVIDVEGHIAPGLPSVTLCGLPDPSISQSPGRIRAAMVQSELPFPDTRVTLNLSPASLQKTGAALDLPLAVAILATMGVVGDAEVSRAIHLGELGMDGSIRPVRGVLPAVMVAAESDLTDVVVPAANAAEASLVDGVNVFPVASLSDVVALHRARVKGPVSPREFPETQGTQDDGVVPDLADVAGQHEARFALEVAAAGAHNVSLVGPPGAGKTMLASRLPGILPPLSRADALAVTSVHSILGKLGDRPLIRTAPFVAPHHGSTMPAIVGGGNGRPKPGAVSQAHGGVLFLDEAPEFRREVLDALRQPLEEGFISVARSQHIVRYPCRFQLVLARNPCPCGRFIGKGAGCSCTPSARMQYAKRLSGPLMDRVDVHLDVPAVTRADLAMGPGEPSSVVAERVREARDRAAHRWREIGIEVNAQVPGSILRSSQWALGAEVTKTLDRALDSGALTLRGYDRSLRLAWTLADLGQLAKPGPDHLFQALTLRDSGVAA